MSSAIDREEILSTTSGSSSYWRKDGDVSIKLSPLKILSKQEAIRTSNYFTKIFSPSTFPELSSRIILLSVQESVQDFLFLLELRLCVFHSCVKRMESFVRDFVIARVLSFLGGGIIEPRRGWRDVVVATHEEDLTYRARFRPVTIFSSSFAHPCGRSFIRRSTPPSIFCNFYQARFAPPSRPSTPMYFASDPLRNGSGYFVVGHILDAVVNI